MYFDISICFIIVLGIYLRVVICRKVGLPWGQFHGLSSVPKCRTTFSIEDLLKGVPIIIDDLQARMANIARKREQRMSLFPGSSLILLNSS